MNKKTILTIVLTLIILLGINEAFKANVRTTAMNDLNAAWPTLKKDSDKVAALVATRTTLAQNKSWFGFFNSFANEDEPPLLEEDGGGNSCLNRGGSAACYGRPEPNVETSWTWRMPTANVESTWIWQDPTTGEWRPGGGQ
ncbi:MAG: hypothetical protein A3F50_02715 [Candidatus Yanofskybacteria bacterium RIFCSPHIGHO2_12_FULL_44_29b]|uniref:Uncharacterized protein n=1 Tax=Candidatus Yanofskybacteria bacterium RIFCSPLOWO2_02_FULL_44_18 TaxID=1802705 RepID=A0A1F8H152_9BACT|nr:MAG: hypothetical protein A3C01_02320 [Candidatus Yanofskybacteria bacterium RIFCSPHIGHO2_02_FULL_44_36b]OGN18773.1 MAG: hypothetical protein A3F50_02715 [Candidatus Yanofskybacteria bacterium RIFCSPHIGHO2_12_FULL_44_29b]OGN31251.1 MAG: hypothetical protein A3I96_00340 [Candidatus Yanofskybacteria bacterium RIFCSPLOWO2_02_FULL_44_18]